MKHENKKKCDAYNIADNLLNYDSSTGKLTWAISRSSRSMSGSEAGSISSAGYRVIGVNINQKQYLLKAHRVAWFMHYKEMPPPIIDHIDGDKLNNVILNLRGCTTQQNQMNKSKLQNNTSGYKGVSWASDRGKWRAHIRYNGKLIHLGQFDCPEDASKEYEDKASELFREFKFNNNKNKEVK
jgi:hypothetical protein